MLAALEFKLKRLQIIILDTSVSRAVSGSRISDHISPFALLLLKWSLERFVLKIFTLALKRF
jgi:hypothetical protein